MFEDERLGSGGNTSGATSQLQGLLQSSIPSASTIDDSFPMLFPRDAFPGLVRRNFDLFDPFLPCEISQHV